MSDDKKDDENQNPSSDDDLNFEDFDELEQSEDIEDVEPVEDIESSDTSDIGDLDLEDDSNENLADPIEVSPESDEQISEEESAVPQDEGYDSDFEDDFADDFADDFNEDTVDLENDEDFYDSDEADWEGEDAEFEEMGRPEQKKKGGVSRLIIIIVALVGAGGLYYQFGMQKQPQEKTSQPQQATQKAMDPARSGQTEQAEKPSVGFMNDPSILTKQEGSTTNNIPQPQQPSQSAGSGIDLPQPAPVENSEQSKQEILAQAGKKPTPVQEQAKAEDTDQLARPEPATETQGQGQGQEQDQTQPRDQAISGQTAQQTPPAQQVTTPPERETEPEQMPTPEQAAPEQSAQPQTNMANTVASGEMASIRSEIRGLKEQNAQMQSSLQSAMSQIQEVIQATNNLRQEINAGGTRQATPSDSQPQSSSADIQSLKQTIAGMNNRIGRLENEIRSMGATSRTPSQQTQSKPVKKVAAVQIDTPPLPDTKPKTPRGFAKTPDVEKSLEDVVSKVSPEPETKPAEPQDTTSVKWVLRAVQQDRAWLSPENATSTLKEVTVGDNIEGIGRVLSISQTNGQWVVKGSQASVTQ